MLNFRKSTTKRVTLVYRKQTLIGQFLWEPGMAGRLKFLQHFTEGEPEISIAEMKEVIEYYEKLEAEWQSEILKNLPRDENFILTPVPVRKPEPPK